MGCTNGKPEQYPVAPPAEKSAALPVSEPTTGLAAAEPVADAAQAIYRKCGLEPVPGSTVAWRVAVDTPAEAMAAPAGVVEKPAITVTEEAPEIPFTLATSLSSSQEFFAESSMDERVAANAMAYASTLAADVIEFALEAAEVPVTSAAFSLGMSLSSSSEYFAESSMSDRLKADAELRDAEAAAGAAGGDGEDEDEYSGEVTPGSMFSVLPAVFLLKLMGVMINDVVGASAPMHGAMRVGGGDRRGGRGGSGGGARRGGAGRR